MAAFYYFIEEGQVVKDDQLVVSLLERLGIDDIFRDCGKVPDQTVANQCSGPNGKAGVILYPKPLKGVAKRENYQYDQARQQWKKWDGFWLGWDKFDPPGPDDLSRGVSPLGYILEDALGREWVVPVIRSPEPGGTTLPFVYSYDDDLNFVEKIRPEYQEFWELAGDTLDYLRASGEMAEFRRAMSEGKDITMEDFEDCQRRINEWPTPRCVSTALRFLGINYRVGKREIAALYEQGVPMLDTETASQILMAATDWLRTIQFVKKKEAAA